MIETVELYYEVKGEGPPLILISGLTADHMTWMPLVDHLSKKYQVITFDNRGVGKSPTPKGVSSIRHFAHDTVKMMDRIGIEKAHIVGQSMGTAIAQNIAAEFPSRVDKLILSNGMTQSDKTSEYAFRLVGHLIEDGVPRERIMEAILPWSFSNDFLDHQPNVDIIMDMYKHTPTPQTPEGFWLQFQAIYTSDTTPLLPKIQAKTLILTGEEDLLTTVEDSEKLHRGIKNSKLEVIPGMAHVPHVEKPELFLDMIDSFLEER